MTSLIIAAAIHSAFLKQVPQWTTYSVPETSMTLDVPGKPEHSQRDSNAGKFDIYEVGVDRPALYMSLSVLQGDEPDGYSVDEAAADFTKEQKTSKNQEYRDVAIKNPRGMKCHVVAADIDKEVTSLMAFVTADKKRAMLSISYDRTSKEAVDCSTRILNTMKCVDPFRS